MERLRTLKSFQIFRIEIKKSKTYSDWCPFQCLSIGTTLMKIQSGRTVALNSSVLSLRNSRSWPPYFKMAPPSSISESARGGGGAKELYSTEGSWAWVSKKIYRLKEDQAFSLSLELGRRKRFVRHPSADILLHSMGGGGDFVDTVIAF